MANISSGHTQLLQDMALRNDRRNALLKVQKTWQPTPCPINVKPVPQLVSTCSGYMAYKSGVMNNMIYYTRSPCGVPESVRLQQLAANTADASQGIPFRNNDGSFSYLPDPLTRFNQYTPYKSPPCPAPLPYNATNAGDPVARIPPCNGPKVLFK